MGETHDFTVTARGIDRDAQNQLSPNQVSVGALWTWVAPWLGRIILIVIGICGLLFASAVDGHAQSWMRFATAGLAVLIMVLLSIAGAIVAASAQNAVFYFGGITLLFVYAGIALIGGVACR